MTPTMPALCTLVKSHRLGRHARLAVCAFVALAAMAALPRAAAAQEPSSLASVFKRVAMDPTTYAPAVIAYDATRRDWDTSQVFFAHGFHEWNERFTVSGLPNDVPVSYEAGRRRLLNDALVTLQMSALNSFATHAVEELLVTRYPAHRRLVKTLVWIDRVSSASFVSYRLSANHYRQAQHNAAVAQSLGYR